MAAAAGIGCRPGTARLPGVGHLPHGTHAQRGRERLRPELQRHPLLDAGQQVTDVNGNVTTEKGGSVVLPNLIPELNYHIGISEGLEFGGRVGLTSGLIEFDVKYRFLGGEGEKLHLAVQPAVGYRALFIVEGLHATLPVIATYDVAPTLSVNVAPYVS